MRTPQAKKKTLKKLKKSVDKLKKVWYNKDTVKELRKSTKKNFLKSFKKGLTNYRNCDII